MHNDRKEFLITFGYFLSERLPHTNILPDVLNERLSTCDTEIQQNNRSIPVTADLQVDHNVMPRYDASLS